MNDYAAWLKSLGDKPVLVAHPVGFDYTFVHWYLHEFTGGSPLFPAALDIASYAMAVMRTLVERYGAAPRAFLVAPLVGAFFIDFTNALIITGYINYFK